MLLTFEQLIKIVTFDIIEVVDLIGIEDPLEVSYTPPRNANFNDLAYDSSNTYLNMGSMNHILGIMCGQTAFHFVFRIPLFARCPWGVRLQNKISKLFLIGAWTRFYLETYFEIWIACLITLVPG